MSDNIAMANVLAKHTGNRHGPEYHWSDNQLLSYPAKFSDLDGQQQSLRTVLLWQLAGMVEGGTDGGAHVTFDVCNVFGNRDVGMDQLTAH